MLEQWGMGYSRKHSAITADARCPRKKGYDEREGRERDGAQQTTIGGSSASLNNVIQEIQLNLTSIHSLQFTHCFIPQKSMHKLIVHCFARQSLPFIVSSNVSCGSLRVAVYQIKKSMVFPSCSFNKLQIVSKCENSETTTGILVQGLSGHAVLHREHSWDKHPRSPIAISHSAAQPAMRREMD